MNLRACICAEPVKKEGLDPSRISGPDKMSDFGPLVSVPAIFGRYRDGYATSRIHCPDHSGPPGFTLGYEIVQDSIGYFFVEHANGSERSQIELQRL